MLTKEQKTKIETAVLATAKYCGIPTPEVTYFSKGTTAGRAYYGEHTVSFNEVIARDNWGTYLETVYHEVAHLVAGIKHGFDIRPHGSEWRRIVVLLGGTPSTTHNLNTSNVKKRAYFMFEYTCECTLAHNLTSIKHNKILRGTRKYTCTTCGTKLKYNKDLGKR